MTNLKPKAIVLSGFGLNCEEETLFALKTAGADGDIVHINDLINKQFRLADYQILAIPGGFSFGDDTGSGNAFAQILKANLMERIHNFLDKDKLVIGICNGCQILVSLGLISDGVALNHNLSGRYQCRWVDLTIPESSSIWLKGIKKLHIPVAHGEGRFSIDSDTVIAAQYAKKDDTLASGEFPYNPNGSAKDTAAVSDKSGKVLGIMPHPERALFFTQRDDWTLLKEQYKRKGEPLPEYADGLKIFKNAVEYFS